MSPSMDSLERKQAYLYKIQFKDEVNGSSYFGFEAMKLEAVALEDGLCSRGNRDVAEDAGNLRGIDRGRWHKHVERNGEEPKGGDVELASLNEGRRSKRVSFSFGGSKLGF